MTRALVAPIVCELLGRKFNPNQPRDEDGRWSGGMPSALSSTDVRVAGGSVNVSAHADGSLRLSAGGQEVRLSRKDLRQLRRRMIAAEYAIGAGDTDGYGLVAMRRMPSGDLVVGLRPTGELVDEDGRQVQTPDGVDGEVYNASFDLVVGEGNDETPGVRVTRNDMDDDNPNSVLSALDDATLAERVDTGNGPTDVYKSGRGAGFRMKGDDGEPVEVEFGRRDLRKLDEATDHVIENGGTRTIETANGTVEVTFRGPTDNNTFTDENSLVISPPSGGPWSIAARGAGIRAFLGAFNNVAA